MSLLTFIPNPDKIRTPEQEAQQRDFLDELIDAPVKEYKSIRGWGTPGQRFYHFKDSEFATAMLLKYSEILRIANWREIMPNPDEEVKIICHRCNGYVFSVSGREFIDNTRYRNYMCNMKYDNKIGKEVCEFEHSDFDPFIMGY